MGYETRYELSIYQNNSEKTNEEIEQLLVEYLETCDVIDYALDRDLNSYDSVKWYKHDEDMKKASLMLSGVVLELYGEGEDAGDIWKKYYHNGIETICHAEIVIPEYEEQLARDKQNNK